VSVGVHGGGRKQEGMREREFHARVHTLKEVRQAQQGEGGGTEGTERRKIWSEDGERIINKIKKQGAPRVDDGQASAQDHS